MASKISKEEVKYANKDVPIKNTNPMYIFKPNSHTNNMKVRKSGKKFPFRGAWVQGYAASC